MAEFSKLYITLNGQALLAKLIAGTGDVEFTKVGASSTQYQEEQLEALTELENLEQTSPVSKVTRTNGVAIKVEAAYSNTALTAGYYMRTLGLYAVDPDIGEILYAVTVETSGNCYMPAYNGITVTGAYIQLVTTVGNAENVSLEVDSGVYATIGDVKSLEEQIKKLENKINNMDMIYSDNLLYIGRELTEFTWEELSEIAKSGKTEENNIHVGDYKKLTLTYVDEDEKVVETTLRMQIAGINTYATYRNYDNYIREPHYPMYHIDWISIELYSPTAYNWDDKYNFDINGSISYPIQYCLMRTWLEQISGYLPDNMKNLLIPKYMHMEEKLRSKTTSSGVYAGTIDLLWLPSEFEVFGTISYGSMKWASVGQIQYPLFSNGGLANRIKSTEPANPRFPSTDWWTMTITEGSIDEAVCVSDFGVAATCNVNTLLYIPICFRL